MEFKGNIIGLTRNYKNGHAQITIETSESVLAEAEEIQDKELNCKLTRYRKKRSLDANAYFWVLADKLADKLSISKVELYRSYIKDVPNNSYTLNVKNEAVESFCRDWEARGIGWLTETFESVQDGFTNVIAYYGSSQYDTKQMSRLLNMLIHDCEENCITTLTERELSLLMDEWHKNTEKGARH